jgi:5-formyltetrahydrofolate cyclo-ligase
LPDSIDAKRDRSRLRREARRARRALREEQRAAAERAICRRVQNLGAYRKARTLAVYLAFDGEPSLRHVVDAALRHGKRVYAPVLMKQGMRFAPVRASAALDRNFFGIDEPPPEGLADARRLDLVLTPLVAFDADGVRLGMGRGYYDRAFQFLRHRKHWSRPKLVGIGYSFQQVPQLERQPWDIPLWGAVTEIRTYRFGGADS